MKEEEDLQRDGEKEKKTDRCRQTGGGNKKSLSFNQTKLI